MNTELYTATATGVTSDDGMLPLDVREPEQLGGPGESADSERLVAALSSCSVESMPGTEDPGNRTGAGIVDLPVSRGHRRSGRHS